MAQVSAPLMTLLDQLEKCRRKGKGWMARCPAHSDKTPSLSISEASDGKVLLHCHSGCSPEAVLDAVGLEWSDLFPNGLSQEARLDYERKAALETIKRVKLVTAMAEKSDMSSEDKRFLEQEMKAGEQAQASLNRLAKKYESSGTSSQVILRKGSDIQPEPIAWLWEGWLAKGKLVLLAGAPSCGKTTLCMNIVAIISNGGKWPDGTPAGSPGSVLIWSGEDDPKDTLVPRLLAAGADMDNVQFLDGTNEGGTRRNFDPGRDIASLDDALEQLGNVRLLIIDPIVSAVTGDAHKANDVRRNLQPIVDLAMKHKCAVLGITHFSKGTLGRNPLERVTGSQAFGALARIVWVAGKDEAGEQRVLARVKSNIGVEGGGISYCVNPVSLLNRIQTSVTEWLEVREGSAKEILAAVEAVRSAKGASATDEATEWLRDLLRPGPVPSAKVFSLGADAGFTQKVINSAKKRLGIKPQKYAFSGGWGWALEKEK